MPTPQGNQNATKTGLRSARPEMAIAALGKRFPRIARDARQYARMTRAAVQETHGRVSPEHEELVNAASRFEMASRIFVHLIDHNPEMPPGQVADLTMKAMQATQNRRAAVARLGLNGAGQPGSDPWRALETPAAQPAPEPHPALESVSEAATGNETADGEEAP